MLHAQTSAIVFRTDASNTLGAGHVVRCLALAEVLRSRGAECLFITRKAPGDLVGQIQKQGFKVHVLPEAISVEEDYQLSIEFLKQSKRQPNWLVVDHYFLDANWEGHLRPHVHHIMVIDDLANRKHNCDVLLDQNMASDITHRYQALVPPRCTQILGPKYVLLRPEFIEERKQVMRRIFPPQHVLIHFGGIDHKEMCLLSLKALFLMGYTGKITLVAGALNPHAAELETLCAQRPNTVFYKTSGEMAKLMRTADIAIGAGGVLTTWERMCLSLPCVTVAVAGNQVEVAEFLSQKHYIFYAGLADELTPHKLAQYLEEVFKDEDKFHGIENYAANNIDGKGAHHVADILLSKESAGFRDE